MTNKVNVSLEDQETVINYSKYQLGEWAEVYTTDKIVMKRFEKFCSEHPDYARLINEDQYSMTFSVHPKCASIYPRAPRNIILTDEQRTALADRMRNVRKGS